MTTKNNKIIAEFIGLKPIEVFGSYIVSKDHVSVNCKTELEAFNSFCKSTKYHSSWNWLMEVVEKIADVKHWSLNATLEDLSESQERDGLYTKADVYDACVEFIKWYNKQNKQ